MLPIWGLFSLGFGPAKVCTIAVASWHVQFFLEPSGFKEPSGSQTALSFFKSCRQLENTSETQGAFIWSMGELLI